MFLLLARRSLRQLLSLDFHSGDGCCHNSGNGIFIYSLVSARACTEPRRQPSSRCLQLSPACRLLPCSLSVTVIAQPTDSAGARILSPLRNPYPATDRMPAAAAALNSWAEKRTEKNYDIVYLIESGWSVERRGDLGDCSMKFSLPNLMSHSLMKVLRFEAWFLE